MITSFLNRHACFSITTMPPQWSASNYPNTQSTYSLWITALVALHFVLHDATRSPSHGEGAVTHSHTLMDLSDDGHEGGAIAKPPKQEAKASLTTDTIELEAKATRSLPITLPMVKPWSPLIVLLLLPQSGHWLLLWRPRVHSHHRPWQRMQARIASVIFWP